MPALWHISGLRPQSTQDAVTGNDLRKARIELGRLWRWDRAVFASELGRAMENPAKDPGEIIRNAEARRDEPVPWYIASMVKQMLAGHMPPGGIPLRLYDGTIKRDRRAKRQRLAA